MELIEKIFLWTITHSIYGAFGIASVIYVIGKGVRRLAPRLPEPTLGAGLAFLIVVFTFPSIPRYQFEKEALAALDGKDWIRVVNMTNWVDVSEPLTWFREPVGSIFLIRPQSLPNYGFEEVHMRYKEDTVLRNTEPSCEDRTIHISAPSDDGIFRYLTHRPEAMIDRDYELYCNYDWSKEKKALRQQMLAEYEKQEAQAGKYQ